MKNANKQPPPPTRVSARLLARSVTASAGRQLRANQKVIHSMIVPSVAKENKQVLDQQIVQEPQPNPTAPGVPTTILQTVPLGSAPNGYTVQVCQRMRLAAQPLFISLENNTLCSVKKAMILANFSDEEANIKAFQTNVQRLSGKLTRGPQLSLSPRKLTKAVLGKQISDLTSSNVGTRDSSAARSTNGGIGALSGSSFSSAAGMLVKQRRTAKQVHSETVKKKHKKDIADKAYLTATQQILAGNSTKTSMKKIIDRINRLYDTALNPRTACRRI